MNMRAQFAPHMDFDDALGVYFRACVDDLQLRIDGFRAVDEDSAVEALVKAIVDLSLPVLELSRVMAISGACQAAQERPQLRIFDRLDAEVRFALENPADAERFP